MAQHHHHVAGDVDHVAHGQLAHRTGAFGIRVARVEGDPVQRRAHGLLRGVARQQHAEAAVDLRGEAAAVARIVGMAPPVALAQELEGLGDEVARGQRQGVGGAVGGARQQCRHKTQAAVVISNRQLDHPAGVGQLAVDRLGRVPVGDHWHAHAHVQLQLRDLRLFRGEDGGGGGAGDHPVRPVRAVAEHLLRAAQPDVALLDPGAVALAGHEQPLPVAALVQHRHRIAGEQRTFLEAVDVVVLGGAEDAPGGGEGAQVGALGDQAVAHRDPGRHRLQRQAVLQRIQRGGVQGLAMHVVERARGRGGQGLDLLAHHPGLHAGRQRAQVVDGRILGPHACVLRGDAGAVQELLVRLWLPADPVLGRELGRIHAHHASDRVDRYLRGEHAGHGRGGDQQGQPQHRPSERVRRARGTSPCGRLTGHGVGLQPGSAGIVIRELKKSRINY